MTPRMHKTREEAEELLTKVRRNHSMLVRALAAALRASLDREDPMWRETVQKDAIYDAFEKGRRQGVKDERERAAKLCDAEAASWGGGDKAALALSLAALIRGGRADSRDAVRELTQSAQDACEYGHDWSDGRCCRCNAARGGRAPT